MPTLKEAQENVRKHATAALAIAENHGQVYKTFAEQKDALDKAEAEVKHWEDEVESLGYLEDKRAEFAAKGFATAGNDNDGDKGKEGDRAGRSIGAQFVASKNYRDMVSGGLKGSFHSGDIELKATVSEALSPAITGVPTLLPGMVQIPTPPLTIADLFPGGTTETPLIRYLVEKTITNAAATVVEGNLKPESALTFDKVDEVLHKIATFLPITDEMLEDWTQAQSYIDARLILFVKLAEEAQLLNGDGTGANLVGLLNRPGLAPTIAKGTAPSVAGDNEMDAVYRQITQIRTTQFLEPDALAIDPLGWQDILLSKNSQGFYYANGPFASAENQQLWGKRVAVSPAMAAKTALVGAFQQGGQVFRKGGITVSASNSHADFFQRNLTAIRAEERLALAVYRPGAFGEVTGL